MSHALVHHHLNIWFFTIIIKCYLNVSLFFSPQRARAGSRITPKSKVFHVKQNMFYSTWNVPAGQMCGRQDGESPCAGSFVKCQSFSTFFKSELSKYSVRLKCVEVYESDEMWVLFGTVKVCQDFVNKIMIHLIFSCSVRRKASLYKGKICKRFE